MLFVGCIQCMGSGGFDAPRGCCLFCSGWLGLLLTGGRAGTFGLVESGLLAMERAALAGVQMGEVALRSSASDRLVRAGGKMRRSFVWAPARACDSQLLERNQRVTLRWVWPDAVAAGLSLAIFSLAAACCLSATASKTVASASVQGCWVSGL